MSGCQRLWTLSLSYGDWARSTLTSVSGMAALLSDGEIGGQRFRIGFGRRAFVHEASAIHHDEAVGDVERERQELFGDDDREVLQLADFLEAFRDVLDDRRLYAFGRLVE